MQSKLYMLGTYLRQDQHHKVDSHVARFWPATDFAFYKNRSQSQRASQPNVHHASEGAKGSIVMLRQRKLSTPGKITHAMQHCRSCDSHVDNHHVLTILQFLVCLPTARSLQGVSDATYVPAALSQPVTEDGMHAFLPLLPKTSGLFSLFPK